MTYITYYKTQNIYCAVHGISAAACHQSTECYYYHVSRCMPSIRRKLNFMPSYLVRTSDMKVVKGSDVNEGYCTLAYSWNQSGETRKDAVTGKSYRVDKGRHKVIFPPETVPTESIVWESMLGKAKYVKFEGLIQEICQDLNIKYIWYDQMCIDQNNVEEKQREIHQMHKIYKNAYCTIALVPEFITDIFAGSPRGFPETLLFSEWMKRVWTLEEAIMSSKVLLVGSKVPISAESKPFCELSIFDKTQCVTASSILYWAHTRTSTKEHDLIFALANIFPEVMKEITIDYEQDIQVLIIKFYGALAKKDISILCFQKHSFYKEICQISPSTVVEDTSTKEPEYSIPIQKFNLPSWTGADGEHFQYNYRRSFKNYIMNGRVMQVTCSAMESSQQLTGASDVVSITLEDIPPKPPLIVTRTITLAIRVRAPGATDDMLMTVLELNKTEEISESTCSVIRQRLQYLSHFMQIRKSNLRWTENLSSVHIVFHDLTEKLQNFAQYVLLIGIQFRTPVNKDLSLIPVIKKDGNYYKSIGVCRLTEFGDNFKNLKAEEGTFKIH